MPFRSLALGLLLIGAPAVADEAPRSLFPSTLPPAAAPPPQPIPIAPIKVEDLAAPTLSALGLPAAETLLGGPLWANSAPPGLELLLARLPTATADPTLLTLQRGLLTAPGPADAPPELLLARVDRLLAMAEPAAAQQLLELVPDGAAGPEVTVRRLWAALAAGQTQPACEAARAQAALTPPWPAARIVCAALAHDPAAVQLDLDLLESRGETIDSTLAGLARAAAAGERFTLPPALPNDALLLPLLRTVQLDVDPGTVAALPMPARRALAENPGLPAAARAAAGGPPRPGPSVRPEFAGNAPTDWAGAMASVPAAQRARWLALTDGLGVAVPDPVWDELYRTDPADPGPAPDLALWRGFELARVGEQRGGMLLYVLLLLDGRPEAAAPVTLRRALDALVELGLAEQARALAAGTGGALGL